MGSRQQAISHSCQFPSCKVDDRMATANLSWHSIPKSIIRDKWIEIIRESRKDDKWIPANSSKVCSRHFCETDFLPGDDRKRRLLSYKAVPVEEPSVLNYLTANSEIKSEPPEEPMNDDEDPLDTTNGMLLMMMNDHPIHIKSEPLDSEQTNHQSLSRETVVNNSEIVHKATCPNCDHKFNIRFKRLSL